MITAILTVSSIVCIVLFLAGFYTGIWVQRHSREVIEREVAKIVTTEKVVEVEKPVVIQVPAQRPPQTAAFATMGSPNRSVIADPQERAQMEHIQQLANMSPE